MTKEGERIQTRIVSDADPSLLEDLATSIQRETGEPFHAPAWRMQERSPDGLRLPGSRSAWCIIGLLEDRPAGLCVAAWIPKLDPRMGFLFVDELYVLPDARRRGVGTALMSAADRLARSVGAAGIRLLARPDNAAARAFYASLGFKDSQSILFQTLFESAQGGS